MDISRLARGIVQNVTIVEAAHILALDQLRWLPVGIAVSDAVAQIVNIIIQIVKVHDQPVVAIHHEHRRDIHIALEAHFERPNIGIKDVDTGIHLVL